MTQYTTTDTNRIREYQSMTGGLPTNRSICVLTAANDIVTNMKLSIGAALVLVATTMLGACSSAENQTRRQAEVREAGTEVMPFDLDRTRHSFVKTIDGGVQTVVALNPVDAAEIGLIREHLAEISGEFAAGNFGDPSAVHGTAMPGLDRLTMSAGRLGVVYRDVDGGGEIRYRTSDDDLLRALHDWFDAQLSDHGADASSTPLGHSVTEEMWQAHHPGVPYPGGTVGK
jgi:hypothetical protein